MKTAIRYSTALSILLLSSYAVNAATLLGENYECQRTDSSKNTISYPLTVTKTKDTYTFQWQANGKVAIYGTGVTQPAVNNVISVIFWDPMNSDTSYGVELFYIKPDGSLNGDWAMHAASELGSEICTKK